jgi:hypothetical protein
MKTMKDNVIPVLLFLSIISFSCKKNITESKTEQHQWISGIPFFIENEQIEHDDRILETDNFLTFSDASSDEVKIIYAQMAEKAFDEIKKSFHIQSSEELGIYRNNRNTKITIYSDRYLNHDNMAFPLGFSLIALDSPITSSWFGGDQSLLQDWYRRDVKHETMHVMQWLFGLDWNSNLPWSQRWGRTWPEFWFSEGIAEYISGGAFTPIENINQVNTWLQNPDHINPIKIRRSTDAPVPDARIGEYYPMFGLAVRYLFEDTGLGKSFVDVKDMYLDMRTTASFRESFEKNMGISVEYYEEHFFELIADFLNQSSLNK